MKIATKLTCKNVGSRKVKTLCADEYLMTDEV